MIYFMRLKTKGGKNTLKSFNNFALTAKVKFVYVIFYS
jgi:hypothetical protein